MKLAIATTLLVFASSAAMAADLPARVAVPDAPLPAFVWTGFYVGANAGYAFDSGRSTRYSGNNAGLEQNVLNFYRPAYGRLQTDGFTGGGQIGYNYQFGNIASLGGSIVIGIEADAAYTDIHLQGTHTSTVQSNIASRTDFVGTARGRLGYAFGPVLLYGTGGFAYAGSHNSASYLGPTGVELYHGSTSSISTGYAYGGGVEVAVPRQYFLNVFHSSALTFKAEYIRYQLGYNSMAISNNAGLDPGYTQRYRPSGNIVRAGVNYKFDSFAAPVVARY